MDILELRDYCLSLPLSEECTPFDETTLVFKVSGKMYALTNMMTAETVSVKCVPERAIELREQYDAVYEGYHMNKRHWNTVRLDSDLPDALIKTWIRDSYLLVVVGLPKAQCDEILALQP